MAGREGRREREAMAPPVAAGTIVELFSEDVVEKAGNPSIVGFVSRVAGESDSEDEGDDEDGEDEIPPGHARVCWLNSPAESVERIGSLVVIDRALVHGNIVARASEPLGQTGTVVGVDIKADLQHPAGEKMVGVDTMKLQKPRTIVTGSYVVKGMWLGRVEEVLDDVTVVFDDGARCKCEGVNPEDLFPVRETATDVDSECVYFPGQRVRASSSRFFRVAEWLKGKWQPPYHEGTVVKVEAGSVSIFWMCTGGDSPEGDEQAAAAPPNHVSGKDLIPLNWFKHTSWQVGDYALPPPGWHDEARREQPAEGNSAEDCETNEAEGARADRDAIEVKSAPVSSNHGTARSSTGGETTTFGQKRRKKKTDMKERRRCGRKDENWEYALQVIRTETKVDVLWQDGTTSYNLDACSLLHVHHVGDNDFWPEEYVVERSQEVYAEDGDGAQGRRIGIVRSVNAKQRTAVVQWLEPLSMDKTEGFQNAGDEEVVSVYELAAHEDYSYQLGDVVIRLPQAPQQNGGARGLTSNYSLQAHLDKSRLACSHSNSPKAKEAATGRHDSHGQATVECTNVGDNGHGERNLLGSASEGESNQDAERADLWWVGEIIGLDKGHVKVAWADGSVSKVGPHSIYVVSKEDGESSSMGDEEDEGDSDGASWETVSETGDEPEGSLMTVSLLNEQTAGGEEKELSGADGSAAARDVHQVEGESLTGTSNEASVGKASGTSSRRPLGLPRAAISLVSRLAAGLFPFRGPDRREDTNAEPISGEEGQHASRDSRFENGCAAEGGEGLKAALSSSLNVFRRGVVEAVTPRVGVMDEVEGGRQGGNRLEGSSGRDLRGSSEVAQESGDCVNVPSTEPTNESSETEEATTAGVIEQGIDRDFADGDEPAGTEVNDLGFKRFECVKECSDHHYIGETGQATSRKWAKAVQQEWSMLQKGLPDTIWVRVYETRMDLLRVAIVGAPGTPYHDNLFLFDLWLPPDFPNVPPVAYYHSWGYRVNPNLYDNGKVCLSLLNTWTGRGTEVWHPSSSTLLQVLVSIQGLVLVPKPYFNEAGYEKQAGTAEGEKNSLVYNESAFLLSCKSMLQLLRRPPQHFEDLVYAHFRSRGQNILASCAAYIVGTRVGSLGKEAATSNDQRPRAELNLEGFGETGATGSSEGFKILLGKIVPKLEEAFNKLKA